MIGRVLRTILRFFRCVLTNRAAQFLFVAHLVLVIYACADKPSLNRAENNEVLTGTSSSMVLIAGRGFHYHYESPLVKTLWVVDLPGEFLGVIFIGLPLYPILKIMPPLGAYDSSWFAAITFLAGSSFQWMLVGYLTERSISFYRHLQPYDERND
jgi:hypothetical protein